MKYLILIMITLEHWYNKIVLKSKKPMPKPERYHPPKEKWDFDDGDAL